MKHLIILLPFLFVYLSHAQFNNGDWKIGIQAGYNRTKWYYAGHSDNQGSYTTTNWLNRFQAGVVAERTLRDKLSVRTGLLYSARGTKLDHRFRFDTSTRTIKVSYIELPVTAIYRVSIINEINAIAGGGFTVSIGISGEEKGKIRGFVISPEINNTIEFSSSGGERFNPIRPAPFEMKPVEFGLVLLAGIEYRNLQLIVNYGYGLTGLLSKEYYYLKNFENRAMSISLAYFIFNTKSRRYGA